MSVGAVPTFCTMNGVCQPSGPPSIFVMFGRYTVVVGGGPGGAHAEDRELGERGVIGRAPGLVPGLVPAAQLARVAVAALAVGDLDFARHDRREALKLLADRAQRRRRKAELGLHLV